MHVEGSPQPMHFNEYLHMMILDKELSVVPQIETNISNGQPINTVKGITFETKLEANMSVFTNEEKKVLKSVAALLGGNMALETRHYSDLYQLYAQTDLYSEIVRPKYKGGGKAHLSFKAWASKVFKLNL